MNKLLKIVALLGIAGVAYAGPSQPPAGNYLVNASTIAARPALKVSSATVSDLTPGICVEAGSGGKLVSAVSGLACGSGGGSVVLQSSAVAFGSASNTVTSDTNTLTWDNTAKQLNVTNGSINVQGETLIVPLGLLLELPQKIVQAEEDMAEISRV